MTTTYTMRWVEEERWEGRETREREGAQWWGGDGVKRERGVIVLYHDHTFMVYSMLKVLPTL